MAFFKNKNDIKDGSQAVDRTLWVRLYKRVGRYWGYWISGLILMLIGSGTQPVMAYLMKPLLDEGFLGHEDDYIILIPVAVVILMLIRGVANFGGGYLMAYVANKVLFTLRKDMFASLVLLPDTEFNKGDSGRLLNRFTVDATQVTQNATEVITTVVKEISVIVGILFLLLFLSWQLTLIIIVVFPPSILVGRFFARRLRKINRQNIDVNAVLTQIIREGIDGSRVIKLFNGVRSENERFDRVNSSLRHQAMKIATAEVAMSPLTQWILSISVAFVIALALNQSKDGSLTVGTFIAYITALAQVFDPIKRLTHITAKAQRMMMATESVFKLIDSPKEVSRGFRDLKFGPNSEIEFRNVCFSFPDTQSNALDGISFKVKAGQTVAFVGRSGAGKTTLMNLIPRFIEPTSGSVLIDGVELQDYDLVSLRNQMALVGQNVFLFDGTLAENIAYGSNSGASTDEIEKVVKAANLDGFVKSLPEGLQTMVGENGAWISGGQRQRIAIARALLKNVPLLLLDEATSALDNESEKLVQESLDSLMQGRTTFVIAHRLSTIKNADVIYVMDNGRVIESGTHEKLMQSGGMYSNLASHAKLTSKE
ncbi:lipid A export permease/ATP-binding protein MsbA [Taylorella asinigenitalis]|uniref:Lipid A export ATP-binding/permease protein MsbA n=1 Tax=Taylorella asinigenitalis (strain MCE3) TaxID=1008459 RepID=G4QB95_TAYAM|nr:lipid A export permease/ATP-binding protein MsbA [Taylorella asinigenitalis]AEP36716.1 Lipid A export ATP-binding/permease protein MsbA [Taylorella asinigenitalis MCE3]